MSFVPLRDANSKVFSIEFTKNLQAVFKFFIFNYCKFESSDFQRVRAEFKQFLSSLG